jgi:predicted O-methyltransferase YrrM
MDLADFADPWEQLRLLADPARNDALWRWLERHAAGRRVLEVGCGTGIFACAAARLGAARVVAVEASPIAEVARALVHENGLSDRVEVVEAELSELEPRPVDLVFGELLNADPFAEGVVESFRAAREWLAPGGVLGPAELVVRVAPTAAGDTADEVAAARAEVAGLLERLSLRGRALEGVLRTAEPYRYVAPAAAPVGPAVELCRVALGVEAAPPADLAARLTVERPSEVGGVVIWFEARFAGDLVLANRPEHPGHFGVLRCDFADPRALAPGEELEVVAEVDEGLAVRPA